MPKTYQLTADIKHVNHFNPNLNYTQHFRGITKACSLAEAEKKAVMTVFNQTGYYVGPDKISLQEI